MNCAACNEEIGRADLLPCSACRTTFHYLCLNIQTATFIENKTSLYSSWRCPHCENVTKRIRNDDTPTRRQNEPLLNVTTMSIDDYEEHDKNILENTADLSTPLNKDKNQRLSSKETKDITLNQISSLLDRKLEQNRQSILKEIKRTIITEIHKTIHEFKESIKKTTDTLTIEQSDIKTKIKLLDEKICKLELDNKQYKQEILMLQNKYVGNQQHNTDKSDNTKKLVLFGLLEHDQETEHYLHQRLINIFQEILNLDLTGYIEEQLRIGRRNGRRPVVIELMSKKMTKYVLQNSQYFRNTGLSIAEYLNDEALQHRKHLQEQLRYARQNGRHAVIRNNKLFIDGKLTLDYHSEPQRKQTLTSKTSRPTIITPLNDTEHRTSSQNSTLNTSQNGKTDNNIHTFRNSS